MSTFLQSDSDQGQLAPLFSRETKLELEKKGNGTIKEEDLILPNKKLASLATLYSSLVSHRDPYRRVALTCFVRRSGLPVRSHRFGQAQAPPIRRAEMAQGQRCGTACIQSRVRTPPGQPSAATGMSQRTPLGPKALPFR